MEDTEAIIDTTGEEQSSTESQGESSSEQSNSDSGEETPASEDQTSESEETSEEQPSKPKYTPNFKLKVYDKEETLDPFFQSLIKDEESEKKVKDFAEKSLAFSELKKMHESQKQQHQEYQTQTKPVVDYYNQASAMLQKGDLESFFDLVGIPMQSVYQYAVQKAQEAQLDPAQQQQLAQQRQIAREREYYQQQSQNLMTQSQQQLAQFRSQELNWVLARPDVSATVQAFDAKNGIGAFRQLVKDQGLAHFAQTQGKEDLSAEQAVDKVMKLVGGFVTPTNGAQPGAPAPQQVSQLIQPGEQPPIIPNVSGKGSSPIKKKITSIAEIKRRRDEYANSR